MRIASILASLFLFASISPSLALDCNAQVNDQAHIISDPGKVADMLGRLGNRGVVAHVVTYDSTPTGIGNAMIEECPSWTRIVDGKRVPLGNMIIFGYSKAGPKNAAGITSPQGRTAFGVNFVQKLGGSGGGVGDQLTAQNLAPAGKNFIRGDKDAFTTGFVGLISTVDGTLARPVGGGQMTINNEASHTGLYWVLALLVLGGIGAVGFLLWRRSKSQQDDRSGYQAEARRVRSECVSGLNDLYSDVSVLEALSSNSNLLKPLYSDYKTLVDSGIATLGRFDNMNGADPNAMNLPERVYENNQRRYENIIQTYVEPARDLARQIRSGKADEKPAERAETHQEAPSRETAPQPQSSDRGAPTPFYEPQVSRPADPAPVWNQQPYQAPYQQPYQAPYQAPPQHNSTDVLEGAAGGFLGGMMTEDLLRESRDRDYERGRRDQSQSTYSRQDADSDASQNAQYDQPETTASKTDSGDDVSFSTSSSTDDSGSDVSFDSGTDSGSSGSDSNFDT